MPTISVVMACYNASRWLSEAIDGILAQTFRDFELILVDDGSTDTTWDILERYQHRDERIVTIRKEHSGLADSLNAGIVRAKGAWIARQDGDDLSEPTRFEEQIRFVRDHPKVVLLGTSFVEIDDERRPRKTHQPPSEHRKLLYNLERMRLFPPHSSAFFRVDEARKLGGYDARFRITQDRWLWLQLALRGDLACLPKPLVKIRMHSNQMSNESNGRCLINEATAATICYFLQRAGRRHPATSSGPAEWSAFLDWVAQRVEQLAVFEKRKIWVDARSEFFAGSKGPTSAVRFGFRLLQSGRAGSMLWEKLMGSSLPKRLAHEWIERTR